MKGLMFTFACPRCGSPDSEIVNRSPGCMFEGSVTERFVVVACSECGRQYQISALLRPVRTDVQHRATDRKRVERANKRGRRLTTA